MKIGIGCDEAALEMKNQLVELLIQFGHEIIDYGINDLTPVLYPDIALKTSRGVLSGECERAILLCGTGIGMSITANKIPGIRAALCHDVYSAERSRMSNNAQIITMGARVIGIELAKTIITAWLNAEFQGGRSAPKVNRIMEIEHQYHK